jgi:predicted acyltransferase (DUF342 family)
MSEFTHNTLVAALRDVIREEIRSIEMLTLIAESDVISDVITDAVRADATVTQLVKQVGNLEDVDLESRVSDLESSMEDVPDFSYIDINDMSDKVDNMLTENDISEIRSSVEKADDRLDTLESKVDEQGGILSRFKQALDGFWHNGM